MDILLWILNGYFLLLIHIWFHELGHYSVGRQVVRIPKENLKIRIFHHPPHVALRDQDHQWHIPGDREGIIFALILPMTLEERSPFFLLWVGSFYKRLCFSALLF